MASPGWSTQLAVLVFLGGLCLLGLLLLGTVWSQWKGRPVLKRRLLLTIGAGGACYAIALVGAGLVSRPVTLAAGQEKYFCEIDCHLAYRVTALHSLSRAASTPSGRLWAVQLNARFDPATMGAGRSPVAPVWPAPRRANLIDGAGHRYPLLLEGSDTAGLVQPLRPGESVAATLLFELPAGVEPTGLVLTDDLMVSRLLIGHERSPFHAPVILPLPAAG